MWAGKDVENRSWSTRHRGTLFIHAGTAFGRIGYQQLVQQGLQPPEPDGFIHGAIIGQVDLVDCVADAQSRWAVPGAWHWILRDPRPLDRPYGSRGKLGLWRPPAGL